LPDCVGVWVGGATVEFSCLVLLGAMVGASVGVLVGPTVGVVVFTGVEVGAGVPGVAAHAKVRIQAEKRSTARSLILLGSDTEEFHL